jgi:DUF971 family protein
MGIVDAPGAYTPVVHVPQTIELEGGVDLIVTWDDGRVDRLSATGLRAVCPCASCRNDVVPLVPNRLTTTEILDVSIVGAYAINLTFSPDGHATGIYPYTLLRELGDDGHVS